MKAFLVSLVLTTVISVAAAYWLNTLPMSSADVYRSETTVRL